MFTLIKTAYNKRIAYKTEVANWQMVTEGYDP